MQPSTNPAFKSAVKVYAAAFRPVRTFGERLERGTADLTQPKKELAKLKKALDRSFAAEKTERLGDATLEMFRNLNSEVIGASLKKRKADRPRARRAPMLCDYFEGFEADAPYVAGIVFGSTKFANAQFTESAMVAIEKMRAASRGSGERRAESLRLAAGAVLEDIYRPAVKVLYVVERVKQRKPLPTKLEFGNMTQSIVSWTQSSLPGFVLADAARIRNAAYHHHWDFDRDSGLLRIHDGRSWSRSLTLAEMYQLLRRCFADVVDLVTALMWGTAASYLGLFAMLLDQGAGVAVDAAADANRAAIAAAFGPAGKRLEEISWSAPIMA